MERALQLVGKTSNEIFMLRYPRSVLLFCEYDLTYFAEKAIAMCNEGQKNGELDLESVTELRNSLRDAHVYIEHNIRTVYDKIVLDCWIDYVCRRDNVGTATLWNRFVGCSTQFEKMVFMRLCDFRYNRAINEWLNIVRVQDYAKNKISFLFSRNLKSAEEAAARRNYFDLIFSVTAKELGCRIEDLGVTKVFSFGRIPSAPFAYPNVTRDIVKNVLADFDYSEDYSDGSYGDLSDQIAMDAFSHMKAGLAHEADSSNIFRSQRDDPVPKVYMPCGLKAVVDLEIDALIESGGWLVRCKRCGRYFLRDAEHKEDYCSLRNPGGKTCLEIYELEHPRAKFPPQLEQKCGEITDMMYDRVDKTMSLSEYQKWKAYLEAMKQKVENGEIPAEELEAFISYSQTLDLSRSHPVVEVPKKKQAETGERVVKPFVPERVYRSDIKAPEKPHEENPEEEHTKREGFFTSPIVQRQKNERGQISHIIRAGEPRGKSESVPASNTFMPFGAQSAAAEDNARVPTRRAASDSPADYGFPSFGNGAAAEGSAPEPVRRAASDSPADYGFPSFGNGAAAESSASEPVRRAASDSLADYGFPSFGNGAAAESSAPEPVRRAASDSPADYGFPSFGSQSVSDDTSVKYPDFRDEPQEALVEPEEKKELPQSQSKPRIIRKNAAAISAYGRIAGTPLASPQPEFEQVLRPEQEEKSTAPDPDPFKDIGSIFDVLEQSETDMSGLTSSRVFDVTEESEPVKQPEPIEAASKLETLDADFKSEPKRRPRKHDSEPAPEWEQKASETVSDKKVPSGIWTEERHLFPDNDTEQTEEEQSELSMLKERKRAKSNKTQRLFDAIMREPDDNPNFRRR